MWRDGCGEVALILVKAGADLKAKNNEGRPYMSSYGMVALAFNHR